MVEIKHKALNTPTAVVALVNGMIGGSILVLPLTSYTAGWADTIFIILITAIFSFYSCYICIIHLGDQKDLDSALLRHFNGNKFLKIFYDFCVWIGMVFALILYFDLIIIQWEGLVPPYEFTYVNAIVNGGLILLWCVLLKFYDFGAHMMGYGIASIAGYLIFLIWVMATRPSGPKTPEPFGTGVAGFAAMMGNAFSIQGFFIPVMKSHPNPTRHVFILFLAYLIGTLTYYYIAFMGSYGIQRFIEESRTAKTSEKLGLSNRILRVANGK